ncbi:MAG: hypothetical protein ABS34_10815 [Opitutaceae bacterium BACL24 MAG-120322-bin51]|jgi:hypothetical protein|nr:MAG: hypothetical protein ABS34_10815 [Opitutaceae bacterium BACL24 MAG-120322-bin51]
MNMKQNTVRVIAVISIVYTLWFYLGALKAINEGLVVADFPFYPALVSAEGILFLAAATIPLVSTFLSSLTENKIIRWIGILGLAYGIGISLNFFFQMGIEATASHLKVGLRLASWIALALLTDWNFRANKSAQVNPCNPPENPRTT